MKWMIENTRVGGHPGMHVASNAGWNFRMRQHRRRDGRGGRPDRPIVHDRAGTGEQAKAEDGECLGVEIAEGVAPHEFSLRLSSPFG